MDGAGGPPAPTPVLRCPSDTPGGGGMSSVLSHRVMAGRSCVTPCFSEVAGTAAAGAGTATGAASGTSPTACRASDPLLTDDTVLPRAGLGAGATNAACPS